MTNIKILDCTLRDGGYINNWEFGYQNIQTIISLLNSAHIDFIETGFMRYGINNPEQSLYGNFQQIKGFISPNINSDKLFGMIALGEFPIEKVPEAKDSLIKGIRLIFKKHQLSQALTYCKTLKNKGYKLFINPTFIDQYSDEELFNLIGEINKINPYAMTIVDSMGVLKEKELLHIHNIIDNNLNESIALGFHSHNNLKLSFSNAQCLLKANASRELIIDSTVFGMGRGAGNICTELLTQYLNDNYNGEYNLVPILKIVEEIINPIFKKQPWGYSVPYYLAAINHCHPNYAKYLIDKQSVSIDVINQILTAIPNEKKAIYDSELIEKMYSAI